MLDRLMLKMAEFDRGVPQRIQHFTKVHAYCALIGRSEGLNEREQLVLEAAAYTHDIGIKPALEKYGSANGPLQEQEGPACAGRCSPNWALIGRRSIGYAGLSPIIIRTLPLTAWTIAY